SASREEATPMHHPDTVPEAALRACPGYRIADAGEPVARSAQRHRVSRPQSISGRVCSRLAA
ncbi:hypothetical protein, partial [Klebsiella michiganensis]|uniref:hypothetical protein n=1 Tax=Klebsiella michiganensis TaxID=1134687 RepID=UPI001D0E8FE5